MYRRRCLLAGAVVVLLSVSGCLAAVPPGQPTGTPAPTADGVVHPEELPEDARREVAAAFEGRNYHASSLRLLDAVDATRPFVVERDGEQYWPLVRNLSDQQGSQYVLSMRPVRSPGELPPAVRREVQAAMADDGYQNESLAFLAWADDRKRPVLLHEGAYYRPCVWATAGDDHWYVLWVEPMDSVRDDSTDHCS